MEWAVDDVLAWPEEDAVVPPGRPMPRWTWDGPVAEPDRRDPQA
jgi:hypothetical protein